MNLLQDISAGQVCCVFTPSVEMTVRELHAWGCVQEDGIRLVIGRLEKALVLPDLLDRLVQLMAQAALSVWPDWYGQEGLFFEDLTKSWQAAIDRLASRHTSERRLQVHSAWLREAARACRAGAIPFLNEFSATVQLQQLARTLTERTLVVVLALEDEKAEPDRLSGFARAVEWFAREADAAVVVVLPESLRGRPELDSITSRQEFLASPALFAARVDRSAEERKLVVCPILGRPHPGSPGEQLLARRLEQDAELGPLFGFNKRVTTNFDNRYLVDLIWTGGKVVVEVDGYGYHSSPAAFVQDRQRDYELTLSGYLVLRLPHDSVVQDVVLSVEKIREFVRFRQQQQHQEVPHESRQ